MESEVKQASRGSSAIAKLLNKPQCIMRKEQQVQSTQRTVVIVAATAVKSWLAGAAQRNVM